MTQNKEQVQVTLQDLQFVVNLIDTVSERGALKGDEILNVGSLRQKLVIFVNQQTAAAENAKAEKDAENVDKSKKITKVPDEPEVEIIEKK